MLADLLHVCQVFCLGDFTNVDGSAHNKLTDLLIFVFVNRLSS